MFLYSTVSTLNPIVGIVVTTTKKYNEQRGTTGLNTGYYNFRAQLKRSWKQIKERAYLLLA
jgi:hypothetical protein